MVSALDSRLNGPGLSPGGGTAFCSWERHFYSHSASLHPSEEKILGTPEFTADGNPAMD